MACTLTGRARVPTSSTKTPQQYWILFFFFNRTNYFSFSVVHKQYIFGSFREEKQKCLFRQLKGGIQRATRTWNYPNY